MSETLTIPSAKSGLSPGSLVHVGERLESKVRISVLEYGRDTVDACDTLSIGELIERKCPDTVTWVTVTGLHDVGAIEAIGQRFDVHPLVLEDILNTHQRPKFEAFDDYLFIVLKSLRFDQQAEKLDYEQISMLLLEGFVFIFKEKSDEIFEPVRRRLINGHPQLLREHARVEMGLGLSSTLGGLPGCRRWAAALLQEKEVAVTSDPTPASPGPPRCVGLKISPAATFTMMRPVANHAEPAGRTTRC